MQANTYLALHWQSVRTNRSFEIGKDSLTAELVWQSYRKPLWYEIAYKQHVLDSLLALQRLTPTVS